MKPLLEIEDLHARVGDKEIIKGFNLTINEGEVHAVMGPNGAGKSTLSYVLTGKPGYEITSGTIRFKGKDLIAMSAEERAREGIFLCMQYPVEIPGVPTATFLKHAVNAARKHQNLPEMDTFEFLKLVREEGRKLGIDNEMIKRPVNVGFSGGEKKRLETLQMSILKPELSILDEADSGLDIDALKVVAGGVNALRDGQRSMLVITHYQRLLNYIVPDYVHIFADGHIVKSGDKNLALELEEKGYADFVREK
ncbi:MAG: Fe-S cluster assembly ATPase SufC [Alphaproteobacteria bacterium]|nr:Fe-S cluster assembly ATPase SufC [Alphaproteobacteria bacterium]MDY4841261.1 Fe-S cluster assembly ATPase SufC [Alphaproteobacteria bacterium]